jgi:hypothetical protein
MDRTPNTRAKIERMAKALRHEEPDRVPLSDFFWGSFLERWRADLGLPADTDIYKYYDLDWISTIPNMDPHIRPFETIEETGDHVIVRTGFEALIRKQFADPMPAFLGFATDTLEKMAAFGFDDPWDERRYFRGGDNQIAGVGDGFARNSPAWIDSVRSLHPDFAVYGSVCEAQEMLWRIIGPENGLLWLALHPIETGRFIERLDGLVIWGDVAYVKDLLFSPEIWRRHFKPVVKAIVGECHAHGLPVIYHGCGNVRRIFEDFIEIGIDAYNPLEFKAGMDAVELRRHYGHRIAFCGNMDVLTWAHAPSDELRQAVLTKLNAAKGGGFIFQSDHSVPSNVSGQRYDEVVRLVREYGRYPLRLGEFDLPDIT